MRRICLAALLAAGLLAGCSRKVSVTVEPPDGAADATVEEKKTPVVALPVADDPHKIVDSLVASLAEPTKQDRYDALLLDAFTLLADRKYAEALNSLQTAQSVLDTEQVRREIDKVKAVIAQQAAAERTARDIQAVLNEGKADEAAKLGTQALQQFGGTDLADDLGKLKREADAVAAAPVDDRAVRQARFRDEAAAALRDQNLRAAAIAFEQALQAGDDAELRRQYDDVRAALGRYDDNRGRAARLRRDPAALEDALDALKQAQQAWDTPQVRMEIDECNFALQRRRDRLGVADFEVLGDVGLPDAGRVVADELLAGFKPRFDLVERSQLGKVFDELKLEGAGAAADPLARQEVGRLANLRYLVVGSLSPLNGVTAQARRVEVRSGLIVQTGRVSAPTVQELIPRLRVLAQMLMMDDDQKMAFEADLARRAAVNVQPVDIARPLPPPPPAVAQGPPPPPIVMFAPQPPPLGGLVIEDFRRVMLAPPPPVTEVVVVRDDPRRRRLLALSLELGDNLFRRGRHRDADRQFQLALTLADNGADIQLRIDRNRPFLPPPPPPPVFVAPQPPVVVVPDPLAFPATPVVLLPPPPPVRPRIIVFNFLVNSPPGLVPPAVGDWAADQFAAHFVPMFEVVDRGEVCWYMGRLGITMRDVLADALARRTLAQALNVRFIVFGAIEHTASFNVTSQMIDAETGAGAGSGMIHVQDHQEMKLRMHELAKQLGAPSKDEQAKLEQQGKEREKALNEARQLLKAGQYARAAEVSKAALKQYPDNVALQTVLHDAEDQARKAALEEARKQEAARRDAELKAAIEKQRELAKQADLARLKAEQAAKGKDDAARQAEEARKQRAAEQLRADGNKALQQGNYALAIQSLQSAASLKPSDDLFRDLGKAKALADEAARKKAADEQARLAAERKKQEEDARKRVEEEKKKREADELARRKAQEEADKKEAERFVAQAKELLAKQQFDAALGAAESARRLHAADADKLLHDIHEQKTLAEAKKKGEEARLAAEKKLAEEKARRDKADAEAKKNQEAYVAALKEAQQAVAEKRYDQAIAKFDEAGKLFRTDAVLSGRKQAEELRDREKTLADAEKRKKEEDDKRTARLKALQAEGQKALDAQQFDAAIKAFREASQLAPGNADLLAVLSKAEHARDDFNARNRAKVEQEKQLAAYQQAMEAGKKRLAEKQYDLAAASFKEALQRKKDDPAATAALRDVDKARGAAVAEDAAAKKKRDDFAALLQKGRDALAAKKYDEAVQALTAANQLLPDDPTGKDLLRQAEKARTDARGAADAKREQDERANKVRQLVATARKALDAKDYPGAEKALAEAGKLAPDDKDVLKANQDLTAARKAAAASDKELKQRKDDYNLAMGAGKDAMLKKNYQAAANSYKEALRLMPGDKDAADLLKAAEKALGDAKAAADAEKKKQADFDAALKSGSTALAAKKYDDAIRAYTEALKLKPGDKDATAGLNNARQAQDAEKKKQKTAADYDNAIRAGKAALAAKKYDDAIKAFTEAGQIQPGDRDAAALLKDAQTAKAAGDAEAKRKADEAKKHDEFARLMAAGQAAAGAKKFDDAIKAYTDALKLMPGDKDATKGLNDAKQAADAAKAPPKPDPSKTDAKAADPKAEYAKQMQAGAAADKAGKYADAIAAYREALKQVPNDAKATQALKNAEFNSHMAAGKKLHADKKYTEASKEYEEALKIILDEPRAKDALKRAKEGKP